MSVNNGIKVLANEIRSTKEYKELKEAKSNLDKYTDIKQEIQMLQKKQMELYKSSKAEREIQKQTNEINKRFQKLANIPEVEKLTKSGENFNKMMNKIYQDIYNLCNSFGCNKIYTNFIYITLNL